jgi:hypothetical protein
MVVFGRRRRRGAADQSPDDRTPDHAYDDALEISDGDEALPTGEPGRPRGPWDVSEVTPGDDLVDLGGLLVPVHPGMELRADVVDDRVVAVTLVLASSALQVQPYAAPRTLGIWDELRIEIAAGITQQGGLVDEADGPFGPELRAQVPVQLPSGQRGMQAARFLGVDGPRWFLRGVITGQAAVDPRQAEPIESLFGGLVVVRGTDPMAPRDPIQLTLPAQAGDQPPDATAAEQPPGEPGRRPSYDVRGMDPFERGPEITETR